MKTDLEIFSDDECLTHYGDGMNVTQICAGLRQGGSGICLVIFFFHILNKNVINVCLKIVNMNIISYMTQ
jgi:hypothetical protein